MKIVLQNSKELLIRQVKVSDAKSLIEYMKKVTVESDNLLRSIDEFQMTIKQEEEFIKTTLKNNNAIMVVGLCDNKIVSTAGFQGSSLQRTKHRVSLGISVLKEYYNLGIGTHMMHYLIKEAKAREIEKMELEVRADNQAAIHLYKKLGFKKEGLKTKGFYIHDTYIDLLMMGYHIKE